MAQTYKFGNGTWATKKGSTLAYNDENNNYKPLPFTTTRNSIATRVNKEGLIEVVGNDVPRIDYTDSADGALLLEPSRTNLFQYSEDFGNSYWTNSGSSESSGFISPDGTNNAFKLIENIDTVEHYIKKSIANPIGFYTWSLFVKAEERKYIVFRTNADGGAYKNSCFDIESGTIVYDGLHQSKAEIQPLNNGWFRVSAYVKETSGTTRNYHIHISDSPVTDNGSISYQGNGISGVYIYGAMLELSAYPTSYIPTNGSTVTRLADTASGSGNSEVFNDSEGVLFADISALTDIATSERVVISDGISSSNRVVIEYDETFGLVKFWVTGSGTTNGEVQISGVNKTQINKISMLYKTNVLKIFINGFNVGNGTGIIVPTGLDNLKFEQAIGGNNFYGKTKQLQYYDSALTDSELETLTSWTSFSEMANAQQYKTY